MNDLWPQFEAILAARAGLQVRAQDRAFVEQTLAARAQTREKSVASYLEWLQTAHSASEWKHLFGVLTNQESYFFRDAGQFELLREEILPALIARNRERRTLKLWSAGCSTGEEPYSLAMTLDGLMPFRDAWNVQIVATDLSETALHKARQGAYRAWSFRNTPAAVRDHYFQKRGDDWVLEERLRQSVSLRHGNLRDDDFIAQDLSDCDLILCRNVFIYFQREAVAHVTQKFRDALRTDGYLLTGHAELHDIALPDLRPRTFAQSVIYQRTSSTRWTQSRDETVQNTAFDTANTTAFSQNAPSQRIETRTRPRETTGMRIAVVAPQTQNELEAVQRAEAMLRAGQGSDALKVLQCALSDDAVDDAARFGAVCLAAQYHANLAQHETAENLCARAVAMDALSPLPYHIQARIADEKGQNERAKVLLKKVIYLAPHSPTAMIELGALYRREGDAPRARGWHDSALKCLIEYSNDGLVPVPQWSLDAPQTVEVLRTHCEDALRNQQRDIAPRLGADRK